MRICRLEDCQEKELVEEIRKGGIFIYPTDTVYGLGCNALKRKSVLKIRKMKKTSHPFSVIAPTKQWIQEHLQVRHQSFLKKLPGRYTLIFEKRNKGFLREASGADTLGVRIPNNDFAKLVRKAGVPFVTTSVNVSGKRPIKRISRIPKTFLKDIDFVINDGTLNNPPSRIFDLTGEKPKRRR